MNKTLTETVRELGEAHDYNGQAEALLNAAGVLYEVQKAVPQLAPAWAKDGKHGIQWSITLAKLREKPREGQYIGSIADNAGHTKVKIQFFFWGSIAQKEAERTYNEVRELNAKIESIFTGEDLAALAEIV